MALTKKEVYFNSFASFPVTGSKNQIYVDNSTQNIYLWNGSSYIYTGGSGGTGNVVGVGASVVGNLPKLSNTTATGIIDSGYKLLTQDTIITLAGTTATDFLNAWKEMNTYIPNEKYSITLQLQDGITKLPAPSASEGFNDGFGYKVSQNIIISGNSSSAIANVGVVGSFGSAKLTFPTGAIPAGTTVGMSIYFSNKTGTADWSLEGLAGTYEISDISGDVITILTPGVTISSRAATQTRKVYVYKSILQNTSEDGSNGFRIMQNGTLQISNSVLRGDADGLLPQNGSIGVYSNSGGKTGLIFTEKWYQGYTLNLVKITGALYASGCYQSAIINYCDISSYPKIISTGDTAGIYLFATNGNIDIEIHNNLADILSENYPLSVIASNIWLFSDAKIFSKEYNIYSGTKLNRINSGNAYVEGVSIPLNSIQSDGSFVGYEDLIVLTPKTQNTLTKEPTGFTDPANVVVNYDPTTRTVTLTGNVAAYWRGDAITPLVSGWVSPAHSNTNGVWFLSYDGNSFGWSNSPWTYDQLQIAFVNYSATDKFGIRECHGLMPWQAHKELHETLGTYRTAGGILGGYALNSTAANYRRPTVTATTINDEDLQTVNAALTSSLYTKVYNTGTGTSKTNFTVETADIVPLSGNQPYYNQYTGGSWQQTLLSSLLYMSVWLYAMPTASDTGSQKYRYLWVQGQSAGSLASQQALTPSSLDLGTLTSLSPEFVCIAQVIIQSTANNNWMISSVVNITGNKMSQSSSTAVIPTSHSSLSNLNWTNSGHTGTAGVIPAFSTNGDATEISTGTVGQVLTSNGSGATPTFQNIAAWVGKIRRMFGVKGTIGTTGTNVANTWVADGTYTISQCNMWLGTAGNGTLTVDIKKNGTTIFANTKPSITGTNQSSINTGVLTTTSLASGDILTLDIVTTQATTQGSDLYVELIYS